MMESIDSPNDSFCSLGLDPVARFHEAGAILDELEKHLNEK